MLTAVLIVSYDQLVVGRGGVVPEVSMRQSWFGVIPAVAVALVLMAPTASGGKSLYRRPIPPGALSRVIHVGPVATVPVCQLGEFGPPSPNGTLNQMDFDGNDHWLTLLNLSTATCPACTSFFAARLQTVHVALFIVSAPCTVDVSVRLVRSYPPPCPQPDRFTEICPPFTGQLITQDSLVVVDFAIPAPDAYCDLGLTGPVFLEITPTGINAAISDSLLRPEPMPQTTGEPCNSWLAVYDERSGQELTTTYGTPNPIMYAEVAECIDTPVRPRTWGQLKAIYR